MSNTTLDLVSGSIGGIAGTIVGHPFDTVKGSFYLITVLVSKCLRKHSSLTNRSVRQV